MSNEAFRGLGDEAAFKSIDQAKESAHLYKEYFPWGDLDALEASLKLVTVYTASMAALARTFTSIGVWKSFGRYSVLKALFLSPDRKLGHGQLGRLLGVTSPNISYLVDTLEEEGLVTRNPAIVDKRLTEVALTKAGVDLCQKLVPAAVQFSSDLLSGFSDEEKQTLNHLLERIQENAERLHTSDQEAAAR